MSSVVLPSSRFLPPRIRDREGRGWRFPSSSFATGRMRNRFFGCPWNLWHGTGRSVALLFRWELFGIGLLVNVCRCVCVRCARLSSGLVSRIRNLALRTHYHRIGSMSWARFSHRFSGSRPRVWMVPLLGCHRCAWSYVSATTLAGGVGCLCGAGTTFHLPSFLLSHLCGMEHAPTVPSVLCIPLGGVLSPPWIDGDPNTPSPPSFG